MNRIGQEINATIEKLSKGGNGLARVDGFVFFVPLSAPGDELVVRIIEEKKNYGFAEIVSILKPGPSRIQPPCPVFGKCGGCNWQHLEYGEQLRQKELIVHEQLSSVVDANTQWLPILPSPSQWRYRNRIQLKFNSPQLGFFRRGSHDIIPIDDCPIVEKQLAEQIVALKSMLEQSHSRVDKVEAFIATDETIETRLGNDPLKKSAFSQVNRSVNTLLIEKVLEWSKSASPELIFDLYAGSGNFSFPLMRQFTKSSVTAVELSQEAVRAGQVEAAKKNLSPKRIRFYQSDVCLFLKRTCPEASCLVILDPPRVGCESTVMDSLAFWRQTRIIYISCDPASLARDIKRLKAACPKWKIARIQPFDMFPQTDHVETLVELFIDS